MTEPDHEAALKTCETLLKYTPDSDEGNLAICHKEALDSLGRIEDVLAKVIDEREEIKDALSDACKRCHWCIEGKIATRDHESGFRRCAICAPWRNLLGGFDG